jgi:hydroxymethylbilane synthase
VMIRIATRASELALWQANTVAALLTAAGNNVEVCRFSTRGDRETTQALADIGGQGLFTAEVDRALAEGEADVAVHSLKDLPVETGEGFVIAAILERGPVEDLLITRDGSSLDSLRRGARVGTSSPRRAAYLRGARGDLEIVDLRGNVPTRLSHVTEGDLDATILARAGVVRLGVDVPHGEVLGPPDWLPAPGQGAVAVVARADDAAVRAAAAALDHAPTRRAVEAERAVLAGIGGGCSLPLGTYARAMDGAAGAVRAGGTWELRATLFTANGTRRLDETRTGADPRGLADDIARSFLSRAGGDGLLPDPSR